MDTNMTELNLNELEAVTGGGFLDELWDEAVRTIGMHIAHNKIKNMEKANKLSPKNGHSKKEPPVIE